MPTTSDNTIVSDQGCQTWFSNWVRLAPSRTNMGLFKISYSINVLKLILMNPRCVPLVPI